MIIEEVKGNAVSMFLRGEGHLIHGCNCFNSMGAGIAKEVKQRIKGAYQLDQKTKKGDSRKLGTNGVYESPEGNYVFNAYTQFKFWGEKTELVDYNAISSCFRNAAVHALLYAEHQGLPIITPLIGAGLAGGDWVRIRELIDKATGEYPVIVVHYDPKAE